MIKPWAKKLTFLTLLVIGPFSNAKEVSLSEVWQKIESSASAIQAAELSKQASAEAEQRSARHWYPRVYLGAQIYNTNDAGNNFFGLMSQRAVRNSDFAADLLNHPEAQTFSRGVLGLDLPLFEGFSQTGIHRVNVAQLEAAKTQQEKVLTDLYTEVAKNYGSFVHLKESSLELEQLNTRVEKLMKSYKLGNRSNPVGFSGHLGMQGLSLRLQGLIAQNKAEQKAIQDALYELGFKEKDWSPSDKKLEAYLKKNFAPIENKKSLEVKIALAQAQAAKEAISVHKAAYMPRLGLFAEASAFNGTRSLSDAYTAGIYMQWNLFDPKSYGGADEARKSALAAQYAAEALNEKNNADIKALESHRAAVLTNQDLLNQSSEILSQQVQVTEDLFHNGSVNALQFLEVLSRRLDLISQKDQLGDELLKIETELRKKSGNL